MSGELLDMNGNVIGGSEATAVEDPPAESEQAAPLTNEAESAESDNEPDPTAEAPEPAGDKAPLSFQVAIRVMWSDGEERDLKEIPPKAAEIVQSQMLAGVCDAMGRRPEDIFVETMRATIRQFILELVPTVVAECLPQAMMQMMQAGRGQGGVARPTPEQVALMNRKERRENARRKGRARK